MKEVKCDCLDYEWSMLIINFKNHYVLITPKKPHLPKFML